MVQGIMRAINGIQHGCTKKNISNGFKLARIFPVDHNIILNSTSTKLSLEQHKNIESNLNEMTQFFKQHGFISEDKMDELHIPSFIETTKNKKQKDKRALYQQRSACLTKDSVVAKEKLRKNQIVENKIKSIEKKQYKKQLRLKNEQIKMARKEDKLKLKEAKKLSNNINKETKKSSSKRKLSVLEASNTNNKKQKH